MRPVQDCADEMTLPAAWLQPATRAFTDPVWWLWKNLDLTGDGEADGANDIDDE